MSQRALLLAVKQYLTQQLQLTEAELDVMFDGQPPPIAGEQFISIWPGDWRSNDIEGLDELYGINITVTRRIAFAPGDRVVNPLTGPDNKALDITLEKLRAILHKDPAPAGGVHYTLLTFANSIISAQGAENGFEEPLSFVRASPPEPKGPEWFGAEPGSGVVGLAQTLYFDGARRTQTIESET